VWGWAMPTLISGWPIGEWRMGSRGNSGLTYTAVIIFILAVFLSFRESKIKTDTMESTK